MTVDINDVEKFVAAELETSAKYLTIPSVSAQGRGIKETVAYLTDWFKDLGADQVKVFDQYQNPAVFASFTGNSDKTILMFSHQIPWMNGNPIHLSQPSVMASYMPAGSAMIRGN